MAKVLGVLVAALMAWGSAAQADEHGRWQRLENNPSCSVWNEHPDHPDANETVTWTGDCVSGRADGHGNGVWRFLDDGEWRAIEYTGEMRDGKEHGRGVKVYAGGTRYEGDFRDGKQHGHGVLVWGYDGEWAGDRYEGEWKDGKQHGRGVWVAANGDRYEGDYRDGKRHGRGVYVSASGYRYEGEFRDNSFHGRGVIEFANGNKYEGDWKDGKEHGRGVFVWGRDSK